MVRCSGKLLGCARGDGRGNKDRFIISNELSYEDVSLCYQLTVWDVFLIDTDFKIERPTRYYRQGLNLFAQFESEDDEEMPVSGARGRNSREAESSHIKSTVESFTSHIAKAFNFGYLGEGSKPAHPEASANGHVQDSTSHRNDFTSSTRSMSPMSDRPMTPMLDPSTNTDPLQPRDHNEGHSTQENDKKSRKRQKDVSKHTFYVKNSQMRLKLIARNEVGSVLFIDHPSTVGDDP